MLLRHISVFLLIIKIDHSVHVSIVRDYVENGLIRLNYNFTGSELSTDTKDLLHHWVWSGKYTSQHLVFVPFCHNWHQFIILYYTLSQRLPENLCDSQWAVSISSTSFGKWKGLNDTCYIYMNIFCISFQVMTINRK